MCTEERLRGMSGVGTLVFTMSVSGSVALTEVTVRR